jgi:hypothetical protein
MKLIFSKLCFLWSRYGAGREIGTGTGQSRSRNRNLLKVGTGTGTVKNSYGSATLDATLDATFHFIQKLEKINFLNFYSQQCQFSFCCLIFLISVICGLIFSILDCILKFYMWLK